jgi:hypothetical protein
VFLVPVAGPSGTTFTFFGGGFDPNENVSLWVTDPGNTSTPLPSDQYKKEGAIVQAVFSSIGLPDGFYTLVAQGKSTKTIAAHSFKITAEFVAPPGTPRPDSVNGSVTPPEGGANTVFQLRGQGLRPNEKVEYWITSPDGAYVLYPDEVIADGQGHIGDDPTLSLSGSDEALAGVFGVHFRGKSSGARVDLYLTFVK